MSKVVSINSRKPKIAEADVEKVSFLGFIEKQFSVEGSAKPIKRELLNRIDALREAAETNRASRELMEG